MGDLHSLARAIEEAKLEKERTAAIAEAASKYLTELKQKAVAILSAANLDRFDGENVMLLRQHKTSVKIEDKKKFFGHLQAAGVFEDLISVNHQTLGAYWRDAEKAATLEGRYDLEIPGLCVSTYEDLSVRKR